MKKFLLLLVLVLALSSCSFTFSTDDGDAKIQVKDKTDVETGIKIANKLESVPKICLEVEGNKELIAKPFEVQQTEGINKGVGAGQATLSGTISSRREELLGETVEVVYFAVQEPAYESTGLKFYNYYDGLIESGNTVNLGSKAKIAVGFRLGILKDGKLSTTAGVSDGARESIMKVLNQAIEISLTLSVPNYVGRGAPSNFSFACMIEL